MSASWFHVDKAGLASIVARKDRAFVLYELLSNVWDEPVQNVQVTLERIAHTKDVRLRVVDDAPDGFADLRHAFTLFAPSAKSDDPSRRGRFNLGEKLVLALCRSARITTTSGSVLFDAAGGRRSSRVRADRGSTFEGILPMTDGQLRQACAAMAHVIPPPGIRTVFNGQELTGRPSLAQVRTTLPTELLDSQSGHLRRTSRMTDVQILEPLAASAGVAESADDRALSGGWIYELGIPVVATGDRYSVNVLQKVPLSMDRDNVTPAYLAAVRAVVLSAMADHVDPRDATSVWVRDAVERHGDELPTSVIDRVLTQRFGGKRVAYDPSDPEANSRAVAAGYVVVHGSQLSAAEWSAARRAQSLPPAGRVTPSPRVGSDDPNAAPLQLKDRAAYSDAERDTIEHCECLAKLLIGHPVRVDICSSVHWPAGSYGGRHLIFNSLKLGRNFFDRSTAEAQQRVHDLLIHELGHEFSGNHLSEDYHRALTRLGAQLTRLALQDRSLFVFRSPVRADVKSC